MTGLSWRQGTKSPQKPGYKKLYMELLARIIHEIEKTKSPNLRIKQ
jgi:hypothetical protein